MYDRGKEDIETPGSVQGALFQALGCLGWKKSDIYLDCKLIGCQPSDSLKAKTEEFPGRLGRPIAKSPGQYEWGCRRIDVSQSTYCEPHV
jgi:hypothetical protein